MRRTLLGVALLALVLPASASAHRPAGRAAMAAMIYGASGRYYYHAKVAQPRSAPLRCFVADIATVVNGSRWGAYSYSAYAAHHIRQCRSGNGYVIAHKIGNRWYVLWEGSGGYPPTRSGRGLIGVPRKIAKDLVSGLSEYGHPLH